MNGARALRTKTFIDAGRSHGGARIDFETSRRVHTIFMSIFNSVKTQTRKKENNMSFTYSVSPRDEIAWLDGAYRKIYFLGPRGVSCGSLVREAGSTIKEVCATCLDGEGRHFFCGHIKCQCSIEDALRQIDKNNGIPLPPHRSTQSIPNEVVAIFQKHAADIGVLPADTTRDVVEKASNVRGNPYPFFKLSEYAFA